MDLEPQDSESAFNEGPSRKKDSKQGMRQVWTLALSLSILQIGFGIVTPIFPYYVVSLGASALDLGLLAASFAMTRILLAGPFAGISDRIGRKPVMAVSLFGFAISNVIYAFAPNVLVMIIARSLEGAISAGFYPAANAYVSDVTTIENRGAAMGYLSMGNMVGFVVGPTVGGVLAEFLGIRLPFIVAALGALGTFVAVLVLVHEPIRSAVQVKALENDIVPIKEVMSENKKAYTALGISMFANMFALGILEVAFTLDAVVRFNFTPIQIGIFFGIIGVVVIFGNIIFGKYSDKVGRKWLIVAGGLVGALALFYFMIAQNVNDFLFAGALLGIAMSMRGPTIQALTADLTDETAYGRVMGFMGAVSNSAYVVGPILGGVMYDQSGDAVSALGVAVIVSAAGALAGGVGLPRRVVRRTMTFQERESNMDSDI
ncbi:MAG: MFS transporter [Candidatus Thorarchaeota archaeon]|nr:MFS transporter [Candidatus Thorarchaeota archaeon]